MVYNVGHGASGTSSTENAVRVGRIPSRGLQTPRTGGGAELPRKASRGGGSGRWRTRRKKRAMGAAGTPNRGEANKIKGLRGFRGRNDGEGDRKTFSNYFSRPH